MKKDASETPSAARLVRGHTPKGVGPVFSRIATFRRDSTARLLNLFSLWGYDEITLPAFEYLDSLGPGLDPSLQNKAYTLQDRGSGHVLILRPDATAQIARLVAQGGAHTGPTQRYSYSTSVFRHEDHHILERELLQTGVELFGDGSSRADWEIISLCLEGSQILGLSEPLLSLSHCGLQKAFLKFLGETLTQDQKAQFQRFFYAHDSIVLGDLLTSQSTPDSEALRSLDLLLGRTYTIEEALNLLLEDPIFRKSSEIAEQSSCLEKILRLISSDNRGFLRVDFALNPSGPYYSGMVFHLYTKGTSQELASGGRYDSLPELFGRKIPATGFAFHMNRIEGILSGLSEKDFSNSLEIMFPEDRPEIAERLSLVASNLRSRGAAVSFAQKSASSLLPFAGSNKCQLFWEGNAFLLSHPNAEVPPLRLEHLDSDGILSFIGNR
ncbi:MAG: ATP phosphoribosyltransferase regulatory subunit [Leptospirales bacterium]